jgi:putative glutamine amidotransferase
MKIGLTYTIGFKKPKTEEKHLNYIDWIKSDNPDIEIVTFKKDDKNAGEIKNCDGLILSGGVDIHPKLYNSENLSYCKGPENFQLERDEFELGILKEAFERKIPVLAICRGFQLVNCLQSGTLIQDLGDSLNKIHNSEKIDKTAYDKAHGLKITKDSLLFDVVGDDRTVVNSGHHQAIDRLGDGLIINCRADDGTIEGIEWADRKDKAFFLGVQWHPERMFKFQLDKHPITQNIREAFVKAVSEQKILNTKK